MFYLNKTWLVRHNVFDIKWILNLRTFLIQISFFRGFIFLTNFALKTTTLFRTINLLKRAHGDQTAFNDARCKFITLCRENLFEKIDNTSNFNSSSVQSTFKNSNKFKFVKFYFFFNIFFLTNSLFLNKQLSLNNGYLLLNTKLLKNNVVIVNCLKSMQRWVDGYHLLLNLFYYENKILMFNAILFKNETLAFNWNFYESNYNLWKYSSSFFIYKLHKFDKKLDFFFNKIALEGFNVIIVTDLDYSRKVIYYAKRASFYLFGITDIYTDPWTLSYQLPTLSNNFLIKMFFIKLLVLLKKTSLFVKYNYYKKSWFILLRVLNNY